MTSSDVLLHDRSQHTFAARMLPSWAFFPVSRFACILSTVTGACILLVQADRFASIEKGPEFVLVRGSSESRRSDPIVDEIQYL